MWIERLEIEGFRRLSGKFEFESTLTLVIGDNEAGKSSLHESLVRALYGFSSGERRRSRGSSLHERRAPWDGRGYGLVASVRDDEARQWRIEWDFATHRTRLVDALGNDVSDGDLPGERFLDIGLDDFRQVCCIDQADLAAVHRSPSLGVALEEAVVNVAGETPVEHAVERLNDFLRSIGARVDNLNPSPAGKLMALIRERGELAEKLRAAEEARAKLVDLAGELALATEERDGFLTKQETTRQTLLLAQLTDLEKRLADARQLEEQAAKGPTGHREVPDSVREEVTAARDRLRALGEQLVDAQKEAGVVGEAVGDLEKKQRELLARVDALAPYADIDDSARDEIQRAWAQLETLASEGPLALQEAPTRDPVLERYRRERDELRSLMSPREPSQVTRVLWISLVVLTLGIAWLVRMLVRRIRPSNPTPLEDRLREYGVASVEELDVRVAQEDRQIADAQAVAKALQGQQSSHESKEVELRSQIDVALQHVKAPTAGNLEERARAYLTASVRHGERREHETNLERVRRELEQAKSPARDRDRLLEEQAAAGARLRAAYAQLAIEGEDLDSAEVEFQRLIAEAATHQESEEQAKRSAAALRSLLADETLESLEREVHEGRRLYEEHRTRHGELAEKVERATGLSEELASLDTRLQGQIDRVASLRTQAETLEEETGDPAAVKERLAELDERIARIEEAKEAVSIARKSLIEAADELKREFAPHLNAALRRDLERISGGRYSEAFVDGDLAVQVAVPESAQLKSADDLSRATKDQIFLVQRLEIARLLAPTKGTAPLLLDDPFAHYDQKRLRYGLELIGEAAQERQIILFSEDPALAELAAEVCSGCGVIELEGPAAS